MKVLFEDLYKKRAEIFRAVDRNETVTVYYQGRPKAVISPPPAQKDKKKARVQDQPFFGMWADREDMKDVEAYVRSLRAPRYTFGPNGPIRKPDRPKPVRAKS